MVARDLQALRARLRDSAVVRWSTPARLRVVGAVVAVVALVFAVDTLGDEWRQTRRTHLHWTPGWVPVVLIAAALSHLLMAGAWSMLVRGVVPEIRLSTGIRLWFAGQLGRFLPTGLGSLPGRVAVCRAAGIPARVSVATTTAEFGAAAATSAIAGLFVLPEPARTASLVAACAVTAVIAVAIGRRALRATTSHPGLTALAFVGLHVAKVAARAAGLLCLLHMVEPGNDASVRRVVAAIGLAYLAGLAAVFAPGGIGVREAVMAAVLAGPHLASAVALGCAVGWRLVEVVAELVLLGATHARGAYRLLTPTHQRNDTARAPS